MLENQFDFVLLAEFFDESLVILAKHLCWDLEQVTHSDCHADKKKPGIAQVRYLKQNSRRKDAVSKMTLETGEALEVDDNFRHTQVFLPRYGWLLTTNSTTTFFESLSEKS